MKALSFYLCYPFLLLIGLLPPRVFYAFTDFLYVLIYYVFAYRKKVVMENLTLSFPEKSVGELKQIEKKFYRHLSQVFLELFRIRWFKEEDLGKYMHLMHDSEALLRSYKDKGKSFILCTGHTGNWEWGSFNTSNIFGDYNLKVYKPLSNQYFDNYVNKLRSRFGGKMVAMSQVVREINKNINNGFCLSMLADQSPQPEHAYWTMFLNRETAFFAGIGKLAVKYKLDVLYYNIKKVKNGYYEIAIEILSLAEENLREEEIQERFIRRLEKSIIETPFSWLWSHRRWKHKKPANLSQ